MTPLVYELSDGEAQVAAARFGWRLSLAGGLVGRHLGPLAAFVLAIAFLAILGWTGLMPQRDAEMALLAAAGAYMLYRLWTRRRFFAARRVAQAWAQSWRGVGPATLTLDERGFRLLRGADERGWRFAEGLDIEATPELVYVWAPSGEPLVWPSRAHADPAAAAAWLAYARSRTGARAPVPADDDD